MSGLELRVLGSGGPHAHPTRASAGYLVLIDGKARVLVDAGGGVFGRVAQQQDDLASLELVVLTHLHVDHTGDLAPLLFDLYLRERPRGLAVIGPAPRGDQPGAETFLDLLFGPRGAWRHLNRFQHFHLDVEEAASDHDHALVERMHVPGPLAALGVEVQAVAVPHGNMPAIAVRIARGESSVVLTGDVSGSTPELIELAKGSGLLVHDMALPERDVPHGEWHAKPSQVGKTASGSGTRHLVLTHFMPAIEQELDQAVDRIRAEYAGPISLARDLATYAV